VQVIFSCYDLNNGSVLCCLQGHIKIAVWLDTTTLEAIPGLEPAALSRVLAMIPHGENTATESATTAPSEMVTSSGSSAETVDASVVVAIPGDASTSPSPTAADKKTSPANGCKETPESDESTARVVAASYTAAVSTINDPGVAPASELLVEAEARAAAVGEIIPVATSEELVADRGIICIGEVQLPQTATVAQLRVRGMRSQLTHMSFRDTIVFITLSSSQNLPPLPGNGKLRPRSSCMC